MSDDTNELIRGAWRRARGIAPPLTPVSPEQAIRDLRDGDPAELRRLRALQSACEAALSPRVKWWQLRGVIRAALAQAKGQP